MDGYGNDMGGPVMHEPPPNVGMQNGNVSGAHGFPVLFPASR